MVKLVCKRVGYYSLLDEDAFFEWINKIKCVKKFEGIGDELHLYVAKSYVSQTCIRELFSLFRRYKIDTHQLRQLATNKNHSWFEDKQQYWYEDIFGEKPHSKASEDSIQSVNYFPCGGADAINKVRGEG